MTPTIRRAATSPSTTVPSEGPPLCQGPTPAAVPKTTPRQEPEAADAVPTRWLSPLALTAVRDMDQGQRSSMPLDVEQLPLWTESALRHEANRLQRTLRATQEYPGRSVEQANLQAIEQETTRRNQALRGTEVLQSRPLVTEQQIQEATKQITSALSSVLDMVAPDAPARAAYAATVQQESARIVAALRRGELTPDQAALLANEMRNQMMLATRSELTPAGQALSQFLKEQGLTLEQACERQAQKGFRTPFDKLNPTQRAEALERVAERAGITNRFVNFTAQHGAKIGKALFAVQVAVAVYQVAEAEDRVREGVRQACSLGGGLAGAEAGATLYAMACGLTGVGAPAVGACALVGLIAGGIAGSLSAEQDCDAALSEARKHWNIP